MNTRLVLIVWRNPIFRETVQAVLSHAGVKTLAVTASEAVDPRLLSSVKFVITEGDRHTGYAFLYERMAEGDADILAFNMDDDRAHLFRYRLRRDVTQDDVVRFLLHQGPTYRVRNKEL